jgi:hypothetical protein
LGIRRHHIEGRAVREESLGFVPCFISTGAVAANTNIPLPAHATPAKRLVQAIHLQMVGHSHTITHDACAATNARYPIATPLPSTTANALKGRSLGIVTAAPGAGQIQLYDPSNMRLGDATSDGDVLLLVVERQP